MATLTVHELPEALHAALCVRAGENGRSLDAEVRAILERALGVDSFADVPSADAPTSAAKWKKPLGTLLYEIGREVDLTEEEYALFTSVRDKTPAKPFTFDDGFSDDDPA